MRSSTKRLLLGIFIGVACAAALLAAIALWLDPRHSTIAVSWGDAPHRAARAALALSRGARALLLRGAHALADRSLDRAAGGAVHAARAAVRGHRRRPGAPVWITRDDKVATVVLVDVSDSVSDAQLEAARQYVATSTGSRARTISCSWSRFAEKPLVVPRLGGAEGDGGGAGDFTIGRHPGAGAGTDIQAAMQLAYGLFPSGYLPRCRRLRRQPDRGDLRPRRIAPRSWACRSRGRPFAEDRVEEIRVVGLIIPDEIKVGAAVRGHRRDLVDARGRASP